MQKIAKFEKVSFEQYRKDFIDTFEPNYDKLSQSGKQYVDNVITEFYNNIQLPTRSTKGSAGYDFKSPMPFNIPFGTNKKIPTGIKCEIQEGWVLTIVPRSSYGFKYGVSLSNTLGIIDSDYYNNQNNEGHIFVKFSNTNNSFKKELWVDRSESFCQGIFLPFGITQDDNVSAQRIGGIGSTSKN